MKTFLRPFVGVCAAFFLAAAVAQTHAPASPSAQKPDDGLPLPAVAQASTTVPFVTYRSVFRETSLGVEQEQDDWRQANERVGRFRRGHVDILKEEQAQDGAKPGTGASPPAVPSAVPSAAGHRH